MSEYYLIAEVKAVYGSDGFVSVRSHSDYPDRFFDLERVYIEVFGDKKEFFVEEVVELKNFFALKFKNFNTAKEAEFLVGKRIYVSSEEAIELVDNTFFIHDLIGSKVYRNGEVFGTLIDVLKLPANDVYVITGLEGNEILIPAVSDYVERFDPVEKVLILQPGGAIYDDDEN